MADFCPYLGEEFQNNAAAPADDIWHVSNRRPRTPSGPGGFFSTWRISTPQQPKGARSNRTETGNRLTVGSPVAVGCVVAKFLFGQSRPIPHASRDGGSEEPVLAILTAQRRKQRHLFGLNSTKNTHQTRC